MAQAELIQVTEQPIKEVGFEVSEEQNSSALHNMGQRIRRIVGRAMAAGLLVMGSIGLETSREDNDSVAEAAETEPPFQANEVRTVRFPKDSIIIGNLTSVSVTPNAGWAEIYGDAYQGTSTTNIKGNGHVSANTFFLDSGSDGEVSVLAGVASQHEIVDQSIVLSRNNGVSLLTSPVRVKDTRHEKPAYIANEVIPVNLGPENAGKGAIINLTIDASKGPAWYAAFPCNEGYQGTSTVNPNGIGATPATDIVKVDSNGNICITGSANARGVIVDLKGFTTWNVHAPQRILDTRNTGGRLSADQERVIETRMPNALFIGRLTADRVFQPGWLSAYPTSGGWPGNSLINPDGFSATSGLLVVKTDEYGRFSIFGNVASDIIIDKSALFPLSDIGVDPATIGNPERVYDSRLPQPISGIGASCNKAAWLEQYIGQGEEIKYRIAVYNDDTKQVTRTEAPDLTTSTAFSNIEIDPTMCEDPNLVFTQNNQIKRRDVDSGLTIVIPALNPDGAGLPINQADPQLNPTHQPNVYYQTNFMMGSAVIRNVNGANGDRLNGPNVNNFSLSDAGMTYASVEQTTESRNGGPVQEYGAIKVDKYDSPGRTGNYIEYAYDFALANERVSRVEVSTDGSRQFALRSSPPGSPFMLFEVNQNPSNPVKATVTPVSFQGSQTSQISNFRALDSGIIVATMFVPSPSGGSSQVVAIDTATGQVTSLMAQDGITVNPIQ